MKLSNFKLIFQKLTTGERVTAVAGGGRGEEEEE